MDDGNPETMHVGFSVRNTHDCINSGLNYTFAILVRRNGVSFREPGRGQPEDNAASAAASVSPPPIDVASNAPTSEPEQQPPPLTYLQGCVASFIM